MTIFDWFKKKDKPEEIPKHIAKKKSRKKKKQLWNIEDE